MTNTFYTQQKHRETMNEVDMLRGNINRMCVTDDLDELDRMLTVAMCRLSNLYTVNRERILEQKYGDKETREKIHKENVKKMFENM